MTESSRAACCAIGVMAKAPRAGRVEDTVVSAADAGAGRRAQCGVPARRDRERARRAAGADPRLHRLRAGGRRSAVRRPSGRADTGLVLADGSPPVPPRVQGFGRCLLHAIQAMLADGHRAACVLNSDSPTLPTSLLVAGRTSVAGAAGSRRARAGRGWRLLSARHDARRMRTCSRTSPGAPIASPRRRARGRAALGLELVELPTWYDVDDGAALARLSEEIAAVTRGDGLRPYAAPATAGVLLAGLRRAASPLDRA